MVAPRRRSRPCDTWPAAICWAKTRCKAEQGPHGGAVGVGFARRAAGGRRVRRRPVPQVDRRTLAAGLAWPSLRRRPPTRGSQPPLNMSWAGSSTAWRIRHGSSTVCRVRTPASRATRSARIAARTGRRRRTERLAEAIISWQWPDGGWNCDNQPAVTGRRSTSRCVPPGACRSMPRLPVTPEPAKPQIRPLSCSSSIGIFPRWRGGRADQRPLAVDALPVVLALRRALGIARHRECGPVHRLAGLRCLGPAREEAPTGRQVERASTVVAHGGQQDHPKKKKKKI